MKNGHERPQKFDFKKSLKEDARYPVLKYFRVERYFTRPLASLVVRAVYNTSITPNHITLFSFFMALVSAVFFSMGEPRFFIVGGCLTMLTSVFDCADGQLARSKNMCTQFGAYLDLFLDRIADFLMFAGMALGYYIYSNNLKLLIISLIAVALYFLQVSLYYIMQNYKKDEKPGQSAEARGLMIFVIFIFSMFNRLDILLIMFMLELTINIAVKILFFVRLTPKVEE